MSVDLIVWHCAGSDDLFYLWFDFALRDRLELQHHLARPFRVAAMIKLRVGLGDAVLVQHSLGRSNFFVSFGSQVARLIHYGCARADVKVAMRAIFWLPEPYT